MNLLKCILTNNPCYKAGGKITPKGVMVHSTGANNPTLKRYVQPLDHDIKDAYDPDRQTLLNLLGINKNANDWNHTTRDVGVHAFIGKLADGSIASVQTLPWNHRAWHAATGTSGRSANDTHISFEICEDGLYDIDYFKSVKNQAVELTAYLCKLHNLDPMANGVVICHSEGYRLGIANGHADVTHWWPHFGYSMDDFRVEVKAAMVDPQPQPTPMPSPGLVWDTMLYYQTYDDIPEDHRPAIDKLLAAGAIHGYDDGTLRVSDDLCRVFTILDRMGKL